MKFKKNPKITRRVSSSGESVAPTHTSCLSVCSLLQVTQEQRQNQLKGIYMHTLHTALLFSFCKSTKTWNSEHGLKDVL